MNRAIVLCLAALMISGCQCIQHSESTPEITSEQSVFSTVLNAKYMIVTGAYRQLEYAERKVRDLERKGYPASIVSFRNGRLAVVICPSDDLEAIMTKLEDLRGTDVCPQDAWILTNE